MRIGPLAIVAAATVLISCASGKPPAATTDRGEKLAAGAEEKLRQGLTRAAGRRYRLALSHYQKVDDRKNAAQLYDRLGRLSLITGELESARRYLLSAKIIAEKEGLKDVQFSASILEALLLMAGGSYDDAKKALKAAGEPVDSASRAKVETVMGRISMASGDHAAAAAHFEAALKTARAAGDTGGESSALANLGLLYMKQNEPGRALENFQKALEIDRALKSVLSIGETLHLIGTAFEAKKDYENALYHYDLALKVNVQVDIPKRAMADREAVKRVESLLGAAAR